MSASSTTQQVSSRQEKDGDWREKRKTDETERKRGVTRLGLDPERDCKQS